MIRFYGSPGSTSKINPLVRGSPLGNLHSYRIADAIGLPAGMPDHGESRGFESVIPARQTCNGGKAVGGACVRPDEVLRARDARNASVHAFADSLGEAYRHVSRSEATDLRSVLEICTAVSRGLPVSFSRLLKATVRIGAR